MFTKYENWAEVEISEVCRYDKEAEAEVEADAVYAYKNGAEEEVWSAKQPMYCYLKNDVREYDVIPNDDGSTMFEIRKGAIDYLYVETHVGDFLNPTIKFSYNGGAWTGSSYAVAGTLYVYGIDWNSKETASMQANLGAVGDTSSGTIEATLSGEFAYVGVKLYLRDSSSYGDLYYVEMTLSNITIDGKKYVAS